jgi:hypothetical protein
MKGKEYLFQTKVDMIGAANTYSQDLNESS